TAFEHLGHLAGAETEHVAQDEYGPLAWRQMLKRGYEGEPDRLAHLVTRVGPRRSVRKPFEEVVGIGFKPGRLDHAGRLGRFGHADLLWAAPAGTKQVEAAIGRDPVQPSAQRSTLLELL